MSIKSNCRSLSLFVLFSACAFAGPVTITFTSSLLTASQGQTVTFSATVGNTGASTVFLNSDTVTIAAPLVVDDTKFFLNFPIALTAGQMVNAQILDVSVPANAPFGLYSGNFDILGGSNASAQVTLGSAAFAVNVVPEPGTLVSVLTGGVCLLLLRKRRRVRRQSAALHGRQMNR